VSVLLVLPLALLAAAPGEGPAAREQARLCEELGTEEGLAACQRAIDLGLSPKRLEAVRELLARRLVALERWEDLVEHFRQGAALHPDSSVAQLRLGSALLFAVDRPEEALLPLREAERLAPDDVEVRVLLGTALNALDRHTEAVAAFEEAARLEPGALERRPAARAVYEAARNATRWP
jgi:tetratricopeptide (TPR) repeat protein